MFKKTLLIIFAVFVGLLIVLFFNLNTIAEHLLLSSLRSSAQTHLSIKSLNIDVFSGRLSAEDITLANHKDAFLSGKIRSLNLQIDLFGILQKELRLKKLLITDPLLKFSKGKKNLSQRTTPGTSQRASQKQRSLKRISIERGEITGGHLTFDAREPQAKDLSVQINKFLLEDFVFQNVINFSGKVETKILINNGSDGRLDLKGHIVQSSASRTGEATLKIAALDLPAIKSALPAHFESPVDTGKIHASFDYKIINDRMQSAGSITLDHFHIAGGNDIANAFLSQNNSFINIIFDLEGDMANVACRATLDNIDFSPLGAASSDRLSIDSLVYQMVINPTEGTFSVKDILIRNPHFILYKHRGKTRQQFKGDSKSGEEPKQFYSMKSVLIDSIRLQNGHMQYFDPALSPSALLDLTNIQAQINHLVIPFQTKAMAQFSLSCDVANNLGRLSAEGHFSPNPDTVDFDLKGFVAHVPILYLRPFYQDKLDLPITGGEVSLNSQARAKNNFLSSRHTVSIVNLQLDPQSPEDLIFGLSAEDVARFLLDKNGNISITFDLNGDIRNPKFSFKLAFQKALFSNIGNTFTSGTKIFQHLSTQLIDRGEAIGQEAVQVLKNTLSGEGSSENAKDTLEKASKEIKSLFTNLLGQE